ncbi:DUF2231 domain-containing protein [Methylibium sp.]|uniref:DUF2231 domain-containing protein n=1 Tax=Methylibium sp. TaxID=2067992 RepID=UPI00181834A8|nr:DUF2231 domain-containing protein [Methylibium sp.]MBA3590381.1 hypothetical protein [Methylibium sp.]
MTATVDRPRQRPLHPVNAFFVSATVTLFLGALLSDLAYATSYQVQWTNFASWLIAAGLLFGGITLVFALVGLRHADRRGGRYLLYGFILLATWVLGFINALIHAKDVWAVMPEGLILSAIVLLLACVAAWMGLSNLRMGVAT